MTLLWLVSTSCSIKFQRYILSPDCAPEDDIIDLISSPDRTPISKPTKKTPVKKPTKKKTTDSSLSRAPALQDSTPKGHNASTSKSASGKRANASTPQGSITSDPKKNTSTVKKRAPERSEREDVDMDEVDKEETKFEYLSMHDYEMYQDDAIAKASYRIRNP